MANDWSKEQEVDPFYEDRKDHSYEALKAACSSLHATKENADAVIKCGEHTFKVHSFLLWSRSKYFNAAYNGKFEEGQSKEITLREVDPYMVYRMILALYMIDYPDTQYAPIIPADDDWRNKIVPSNFFNPSPKPQVPVDLIESITEGTWISSFNTNVRMYALADRYDVSGLKQVVEKRIKHLINAARYNQNTDFAHELLAEIPLIYETTPASDRGLRNCVLDYVKSHWVGLSASESIKAVISEAPEFALELITTMSQSYLYEGTCQRCHRTDKWTAERVRCLCGNAETVL